MKGGSIMNNKANGWISVTGACIIGLGVAIKAYGFPEIGESLEGLGTAVMGYGIAHKIVKSSS